MFVIVIMAVVTWIVSWLILHFIASILLDVIDAAYSCCILDLDHAIAKGQHRRAAIAQGGAWSCLDYLHLHLLHQNLRLPLYLHLRLLHAFLHISAAQGPPDLRPRRSGPSPCRPARRARPGPACADPAGASPAHRRQLPCAARTARRADGPARAARTPGRRLLLRVRRPESSWWRLLHPVRQARLIAKVGVGVCGDA